MPELKLNDTAVSWKQVDDDIVAIDLKRSDYITVTPSARTLWLLLAAGTTEEALVDSLVLDHAINEDRAARDVAAFVGELRQRGLLTGY